MLLIPPSLELLPQLLALALALLVATRPELPVVSLPVASPEPPPTLLTPLPMSHPLAPLDSLVVALKPQVEPRPAAEDLALLPAPVDPSPVVVALNLAEALNLVEALNPEEDLNPVDPSHHLLALSRLARSLLEEDLNLEDPSHLLLAQANPQVKLLLQAKPLLKLRVDLAKPRLNLPLALKALELKALEPKALTPPLA